MLLPNNKEINAEILNEKLISISAHRRRAAPLFASPHLNDGRRGGAEPGSAASLDLLTTGGRVRDFIRRIPVVGTLTVGIYRRTRQLLAPGIHWRHRLRLIPLVGPVSAWAYSLLRLNTIRQRVAAELLQLRYFQEAAKHTLEQLNARINHLETQQIEQARRLNQVDALQLDQHHRIDHVDALQIEQYQHIDAINIAPRLNHLEEFSRASGSANNDRDNRIASLTRELRQLMTRGTLAPASALAAASASNTLAIASTHPNEVPGLDSFYVEFEDAFRGTREDITERLTVYLPYLDKLIGDDTAHIVDAGCGRGEWLGLLRQHGINATGIDLNQDMVEACRAMGLQAQCMDVIQYLRQQPEGSLAAVTGFHIIEHLPFETLLALFDAALRALRPDGMVIFETPNPENLQVGACNFYSDPTHLNPIVPVVAQFMVRQRGFARADILRLHPYPDSHLLPEDSELAKRFNNALYGPQDFAVLAWKSNAI